MSHSTTGILQSPKSIDFLDFGISFAVCFSTILIFLFLDHSMLHWFLLPLFLCGMLIGVDAVRWLRGKLDTFDSKGIIGIIGFHFFFVSSLLIVYWNVGSGRIRGLITDWRPWLGYLAVLNAVGLVCYQIVQHWTYKRSARAAKTHWTLNQGKATIYMPIFLLVVVACQIIFVIQMGGYAGYLAVQTYGIGTVNVTGLGPIMVVGRSVPILFIIAITVWRFPTLNRQSQLINIGGILILVLIVQFAAGGLSGSRSDTIWGLFWYVGIVHFFWRKIPTKLILIAMIPLLFFMYLYGFYKSLGSQVFELFGGQGTLESFEYQSKRTFEGLLIGDLSRSDLHAAQIFVLTEKPWHYRYRYGSTYPSSIVPFVPRVLWPGKPEDAGKVFAGTEMLKGPGDYRGYLNFHVRSTHIYALAGEAMLNFGVFGIPIAFCVWGYFVGKIRKGVSGLSVGDTRLLVAPFFLILSFLLLTHDGSNIAAVILFKGLIPISLIYLISDKIPVVNTGEMDLETTEDVYYE